MQHTIILATAFLLTGVFIAASHVMAYIDDKQTPGAFKTYDRRTYWPWWGIAFAIGGIFLAIWLSQ